MTTIKAVLFDIDGTLLNSNDAHAHAWIDALRGHGRDLPFDLVRAKIGKGGDKLLMEVAGIDDESPDGKLIIERRVALLKAQYLPDLGPFPGARALVERLRSQFLCCVVTSAGGNELKDLLRAASVADLFEQVVTSDDADRSKPDPDLVQAALDKLGVGPREAIMIGDTPYDIASAKRTGVGTIAFRSGGWSDADLEGAVAIYDGPADLLAKIDRSPLVAERVAV